MDIALLISHELHVVVGLLELLQTGGTFLPSHCMLNWQARCSVCTVLQVFPAGTTNKGIRKFMTLLCQLNIFE